MKFLISRFQLRNLLFFTTFIILIALLVRYFKPGFIYQHIFMMILFFFLLSLLSLMIVNYGFNKNQKLITNYFLSATVIRLLLSIVFALLFIYFDRENSIIFAVNFIVLYLVFLGFDISAILTKLAARSEKN